VLGTAAQEANAQDRMREEARIGRELYDQADRKLRDDWLRAYLSSSGGKITLRRLRLNAAHVDENTVLGDADLIGDSSRFIFTKTNAPAARRTQAA
jgi:hypothetical protein